MSWFPEVLDMSSAYGKYYDVCLITEPTSRTNKISIYLDI